MVLLLGITTYVESDRSAIGEDEEERVGNAVSIPLFTNKA